jgi:hypothetical protein
MGRPKKTFTQKVQEEMPEFANEVAGLGVPDLNSRLAVLAKANEENEQLKENDEDLEAAKNEASELAAPFRDAKKALRLKTRYVVALIKEKGGA